MKTQTTDITISDEDISFGIGHHEDGTVWENAFVIEDMPLTLWNPLVEYHKENKAVWGLIGLDNLCSAWSSKEDFREACLTLIKREICHKVYLDSDCCSKARVLGEDIKVEGWGEDVYLAFEKLEAFAEEMAPLLDASEDHTAEGRLIINDRTSLVVKLFIRGF